jgi:hypothetical protein
MRRWPWLLAASAGLAVGLGALLLVSLWSYFDAGGTLGGYGEAAGSQLDDEQYARNMARRAWVAALVAGSVPATYAAYRAWTARTDADRRRALMWLGLIAGGIAVAGLTPAIVHAVV